MKLSKPRRLRRPHPTQRLALDVTTLQGLEMPDPHLVANAFTKLRLVHRARILRRLLMPLGPMALAVLGGGAFAKFATPTRWPQMLVTLEDAARVTSSQILDVVRYVEQSSPHVVHQVLVALARDPATAATLGVSAAAVAMRHLARRKASRVARY